MKPTEIPETVTCELRGGALLVVPGEVFLQGLYRGKRLKRAKRFGKELDPGNDNTIGLSPETSTPSSPLWQKEYQMETASPYQVTADKSATTLVHVEPDTWYSGVVVGFDIATDITSKFKPEIPLWRMTYLISVPGKEKGSNEKIEISELGSYELRSKTKLGQRLAEMSNEKIPWGEGKTYNLGDLQRAFKEKHIRLRCEDKRMDEGELYSKITMVIKDPEPDVPF